MQKFVHDLRSIILPSYDDLLNRLLRLLPRSISAASLTTLLATFSSLFKHLLVPATESDILQRTWKHICAVLPECNPEVQRAMAEVWGSLLRRLSASKRETAVEVMASDLGGMEEACAWAYIFACKVRSAVYFPGKFLKNCSRLVRVANTSYSYPIHSGPASPDSP
jgi:U3 small nucleolar RNA-associated protein 20